MNQQLQNLPSGAIVKDIFQQYDINGKKYHVVAEIKKDYYTRVYFNNVLVAELPSASVASENILLNLCEDWIRSAEAKIAMVQGVSGVMFYPNDFDGADIIKTCGKYKIKYIFNDNIYSYLNDQTTMYRNYNPDIVGLLAAKFEAEQKLKEMQSEPQR